MSKKIGGQAYVVGLICPLIAIGFKYLPKSGEDPSFLRPYSFRRPCIAVGTWRQRGSEGERSALPQDFGISLNRISTRGR